MRNLLHKWVSYVRKLLIFYSSIALFCLRFVRGCSPMSVSNWWPYGKFEIWWFLLERDFRYMMVIEALVDVQKCGPLPYSILVVIWIICMKKNAKIFNDYLNWWIILGLDSFSNFSLGVNHQRVWWNSFSILLMAWVVFALED